MNRRRDLEKLDGGPGAGRRAWSLASEIDWGSIDIAAAKSDQELLMLVRRAALRAARRTVGLSHLLGALTLDAVASALLAREIHDSWKHFHALSSYLDVAEYAPPIVDAELDQHRRATPGADIRNGEDAAARITELLDDATRDGAIYHLIRARAPDPALAKLADRIAEDRLQHSLALTRYLAGCHGVANERTA